MKQPNQVNQKGSRNRRQKQVQSGAGQAGKLRNPVVGEHAVIPLTPPGGKWLQFRMRSHDMSPQIEEGDLLYFAEQQVPLNGDLGLVEERNGISSVAKVSEQGDDVVLETNREGGRRFTLKRSEVRRIFPLVHIKRAPRQWFEWVNSDDVQ